MTDFIDTPSPNHEPRPEGAAIDMLVMHYTGMRTGDEALARLCDPQAKVSAHYLIQEDGAVHRLVAEERRAWHAGVAFWRGAGNINDRSIGIELVNPGHEFGYRPFTRPQMEALRDLSRDILARHPIPPHNVVGHSDVAPERKADPGELFDWRWLARAGIGLWPWEVAKAAAGGDDRPVEDVQAELAFIGYGVPRHGRLCERTRAAIAAFQRHWRPACVDGHLDDETVRVIEAVARLVGAAAAE